MEGRPGREAAGVGRVGGGHAGGLQQLEGGEAAGARARKPELDERRRTADYGQKHSQQSLNKRILNIEHHKANLFVCLFVFMFYEFFLWF